SRCTIRGHADVAGARRTETRAMSTVRELDLPPVAELRRAPNHSEGRRHEGACLPWSRSAVLGGRAGPDDPRADRRRRADRRGDGWIFGHTIDGLQAELARVPFADTSVYKVPEGLSDEDVLFLADILPTAFEVGVLNGGVRPGDIVAVVGAGPIGLATIMTAKLFTPGHIVAIDLADARLEKALEFGADSVIDNSREDAVAAVMELTDGLGVDVAVEAVGVPATFELCAEIVRSGGRVANVGVHGHPATLHLETLWIRDVTITT